MEQQRFGKLYMWSIVTFGSGITLLAISQLPFKQLNLRFVPGIVVEVRDMLTNDPIASNAIGTLQDGTYQETMQPYKAPQDSALLSLQGAIERPGTYDVLVQESGYRDWSMQHVTVQFVGCDVVTVYLEADMIKVN